MAGDRYTHVEIRSAKNGQVIDMLSIDGYVDLHGVAGFCLHKSHKESGIWIVTHIASGAECGRGRTKEGAQASAREKSMDRTGVYAGVLRVREFLAGLGVVV